MHSKSILLSEVLIIPSVLFILAIKKVTTNCWSFTLKTYNYYIYISYALNFIIYLGKKM